MANNALEHVNRAWLETVVGAAAAGVILGVIWSAFDPTGLWYVLWFVASALLLFWLAIGRASIWECVARVLSSECFAGDPPEVDPTSLDNAMMADASWRRGEWSNANTHAHRVLAESPKHFHALAILVQSHSHLGNRDAARAYAQRLVRAQPPNWAVIKVFCALLGARNLLTSARRVKFRWILQRCDEEAEVDRRHLEYAHALLETEESHVL